MSIDYTQSVNTSLLPVPISTGLPDLTTLQPEFLTKDAAYNGEYMIDSLSIDVRESYGKLPMPNTTTGMTIVNVSAPHGFLVITFEKVRKENPPLYPLAVPSDTNRILLHRSLQSCAPGVMANMGTRVFAIRGIYVYALLAPYNDGDDLPLGVMSCEQQQSVSGYAAQKPMPVQASPAVGSTVGLANPIIPGRNAVRMF
jgi:hypothetical protein